MVKNNEDIVVQWKQNPYYQYFCGFDELQIVEPCHSTELVKFRNRIGVDGMKVIFGMSVSLHGKKANEKGIHLVSSSLTTFDLAGILYKEIHS